MSNLTTFNLDTDALKRTLEGLETLSKRKIEYSPVTDLLELVVARFGQVGTGIKSCLLIDGNAFFYRSQKSAHLANSSGADIGNVLTFQSQLTALLRIHGHEHVVVCFDPPHPYWRHEYLAGYKAKRKPKTYLDTWQLAECRKFCQLMGVPTLCLPGYEADDLMMVLGDALAKQGTVVFLESDDKDHFQLCRYPHTFQTKANLKKISIACKTPESLDGLVSQLALNLQANPATVKQAARVDFSQLLKIKEHPVAPEVISSYLCFVGDSSDNIAPACPGLPIALAEEVLKLGDLPTIFHLLGCDFVQEMQAQQGVDSTTQGSSLASHLGTRSKSSPSNSEAYFNAMSAFLPYGYAVQVRDSLLWFHKNLAYSYGLIDYRGIPGLSFSDLSWTRVQEPDLQQVINYCLEQENYELLSKFMVGRTGGLKEWDYLKDCYALAKRLVAGESLAQLQLEPKTEQLLTLYCQKLLELEQVLGTKNSFIKDFVLEPKWKEIDRSLDTYQDILVPPRYVSCVDYSYLYR